MSFEEPVVNKVNSIVGDGSAVRMSHENCDTSDSCACRSNYKSHNMRTPYVSTDRIGTLCWCT